MPPSSRSKSARPAQFGFDHVAARLVVVDGRHVGESFVIHGRAVIGRSVNCDLVLPDERVSRVHAEIAETPQGYAIRDLASSNGVIVNGELTASATLRNNDELLLGDQLLRFVLDVPQEARDAASTVVVRTGASSTPQVRLPAQTASLHVALVSGKTVELERAHARLQSLEKISQKLSRLRELGELYPLIIDQILEVLPAERATLFRAASDGRLEPKVARNRLQGDGQVEVSQTILEEVVQKRVSILTADATADSKFDASKSILRQNIRSAMAVPVEYEDELLGVIYLDSSTRTGAFTEDDLRFVTSVGGVAAVAIRNAIALSEVRSAGEQLNRAYLSMMAVLANAIEARDHYTIGHTWRVTRFTQVLARHLGWDAEKVAEIEVGGVLHDIGKIGVPDAILRKPGPLSPEEYEQMKLHPEIGARMLQDVPHLQHIIPYVLYHQERWDGRGYPHGLAGEDIPVEGRVIAVADTLDAMTSTRPYRRGMDPEVAMDEMRRQRGKQFDPATIDALLAAYEAGDLTSYLQVGMREVHDVICPFCSTYFAPNREEMDSSLTTCPTCNRALKLRLADERLYAELA